MFIIGTNYWQLLVIIVYPSLSRRRRSRLSSVSSVALTKPIFTFVETKIPLKACAYTFIYY